MRFLLDTNAVSESKRPRPNRAFHTWLLHNEAASVTCEMVIGELYKGAYHLPLGSRRTKMLAVTEAVLDEFEGRVLPLDRLTIRAWGELNGDNLRKGRKIAVADSLIGAVALVHDLTVVTRNTADFPPEVPTLSPWK